MGSGSQGSRRPRVTVRIDSVADRGMALGRLQGKAVFVPFGAPGDVLELEIVRDRPRHAEARIARIVEPSPLRREPPCPHFGACGGCQWQHLSCEVQLAAKNASFRSLLQTRLGLGVELFRPPIPSPKEWGYRNRVGLKVRCGTGGVTLGYFERGTHRPVPLQDCPIAHESIRSFLGPLGEFLDRFPAARAVPQVDLQVDDSNGLWAVIHLLGPLRREAAAELAAFCRLLGLAGAHTQIGRKSSLAPAIPGPPRMPFQVEAGGRVLSLEVSPGGFVQANHGVNGALVDVVCDLAVLYRGAPVVDVCCGSGNFTLPLALAASQVAAIEAYPPAARDAAHNAAKSGFQNVRVLSAPAANALEKLTGEGFRPAFALLDPPREGAADAVGPLADLGPEWVLYVSCSPATLVRDLSLLHGRGYRVAWARIADMFPQTAHVESLTLLHRACAA